ncbi:hypothetical protein K2173_026083 [Erythroxylum novogranatense]|uniref:BHLH domain-containing protein n=1 Tax=Erythroxylum novogranatense TaxID=1862640 RepID=A0AAV8SIL7_9ROSI|nr:hypothetical protein K2173_026083 [Erythroxylum novogranatense]
MVKSAAAKSHLDEEDEADGYDSSSYRGEVAKGDGKSSEQKVNIHRSKHSETEQRRRSKINERFQILRDLIPQNDQKKDKASFLLEVIEYIQFLQEKLQMYEGAYQAWSREPAKLVPWKNHYTPAESLMDHPQMLKNSSAHENSALLTNVHDSIESGLGTGPILKALDHPPGSTTPSDPFNLQGQSNLFTATKRDGVPAQSLEESLSDAENLAYQLQSQPWQSQACAIECAAQVNALHGQELISDNGSDSLSSSFSQGLLNTLTRALQSSGVDLSQTSISVQLDMGKLENNGITAMASNSKDRENQYLDNQAIEQIVIGNCGEDSDQAHKRLRTERSWIYLAS